MGNGQATTVPSSPRLRAAHWLRFGARIESDPVTAATLRQWAEGLEDEATAEQEATTETLQPAE